MKYIDIDSNSNKVIINAIQCYEVLKQAEENLHHYRGGVSWQTINGKEYLIYRLNAQQNKSLGRKSAETEAIYENFQLKKKEISERVKSLTEQQQKHARMCVALRANRTPAIVAKIARKLAQVPELAKKNLIVGTNALYAYEAAAAVYFEAEILATDDIDILWDSRKKISIASTEPEGFIGLLKKVDKSFETMGKNKFRAANKDGFIVDLIQPLHKNAMFCNDSSMSDFSDDLVAVEIKGLDWLVSCPKFKAIVIDDKGFPAPLTVPDPRAYAMHKFWLSCRDDREPAKKNRDLEQSRAVFNLVINKLCYLDFSDKALRAMPFKIVENYKSAMQL